ncbi:hypothetical protein [Asaia sp. VD9]|uniref:hypothetical protein n=1 Tax=Asaia sp. VD9 TaxID=3081235 RepID=UPI0030190525
MSADMLCCLGGAVLGIGLLLAIRPALATLFPLLLQLGATGIFLGGVWAHHALAARWGHGSWALAGFMMAPLCLMPVTLRLSGERVAGAKRAASGLGAGPSARLRHLWAPLLRLPVALSCVILAIGVALCFLTPPHAHV